MDTKKFSDLEVLVEKLKLTGFKPELFDLFKLYPINKSFIDYFIASGGKVEFQDYPMSGLLSGEALLLKNGEGRHNFKIVLKKNVEPFKRDISLFHELVHAKHILAGIYVPSLDPEDENFESVVEYYARLYRADPKLLRHAVLAFGLEPAIYDKTSFEAHKKDQEGQLLLDFTEKYTQILME